MMMLGKSWFDLACGRGSCTHVGGILTSKKRVKSPVVPDSNRPGTSFAIGMWQSCLCRFVLLIEGLEPGALPAFPGSPSSRHGLTVSHVGVLGCLMQCGL